MKLNSKTLILYFCLAICAALVWFKLYYPQLAFINLSVNRHQALKIASNYLATQGQNPENFKNAIVFGIDTQTDQYLQHTIGFDQFNQFIAKENFDLFFWIVRFFKDKEKDEYRLTVSSATGEVTSYKHVLEESVSRDFIEKEKAQGIVSAFLTKEFGFRPDDYSLKGDVMSSLDNRKEYAFAWQKNDVSIPWDADPSTHGTGKLVTGATISGNEILSFSKNTFLIPDQFNRHVEEMKDIGRNLSTIIRLFYYFLFISAIFYVASRRNDLSMHLSKKFYIGVAGFSFFLSLLANLNEFQFILFDYNTSTPFNSYLGRYVINTIVDALFITAWIIMPSLAGEFLHAQELKQKREGSFLHYIQSTFLSREVCKRIVLGYFACIILLGFQSILIKLGQKYFEVWVEHNWIGHLSSTYLPFLVAFTIAYKASFSEEIMYRLFTISWGKKLFKNLLVAAIFSSLIWGFAHSGYNVFPTWFRALEVSLLGFLFAYVYLQFGIIPVIVAHYLFDAFWNCTGHLFGHASSFDFYSSLLVLLLPLFFAVLAFWVNREEVERPLSWHLNRHQIHNLKILQEYLQHHPETWRTKDEDQAIKDIAQHGWDTAVVEEAFKRLKKTA